MARSFDDKKPVTQKIVGPGPASSEKYVPHNPDINKFARDAELQSEVFTKDITDINENVASVTTDDLQKRVDQARMDNKDDSVIPQQVGLYDIDSAVSFFINDVVKPTVLQNGEVMQIPLIYGSPERWSSQSKYGYYRDNQGKLMLPLIMYRRTGFQKNEQIIFPRTDALNRVSTTKWDRTTRYDKFDILSKEPKLPNVKPSGYTLTLIPNYVTISYEFVIWTAFIEHLNPIVEKINFTDNTYWGDPDRFKFRTMIESFTDAIELMADNERVVKTSFTATLYGYLLPRDFGGKNTTKVSIAPKKVVFDEDIMGLKLTGKTLFRHDAEYADFNLDFQNDKTPDIDLQVM